VRWADGSSALLDDPYRFGAVLGEMDVWLMGEGTHLRPYEVLGATPREFEGVQGTAFAVWAPNAARVSVVGDFNLWDGRPVTLRRFTNLTPGRRDDVSVPLSITVPPSPGRPLFAWLYGNGRQFETVAPHIERASLVQESSAAPDAALPQLGAAVLDGDPDTAWVDAGPRGAAGEWVQVPTHRMGRLRALTLTQPAGGARIRAARLTCLDLDGNAPTLTEVAREALTFEDRAGVQRALLPQGVGPCHAARLTVEALHGPPDGHVRVAELAFTD
jgi:hypothetical protein